jgi:hypothetical protein
MILVHLPAVKKQTADQGGLAVIDTSGGCKPEQTGGGMYLNFFHFGLS